MVAGIHSVLSRKSIMGKHLSGGRWAHPSKSRRSRSTPLVSQHSQQYLPHLLRKPRRVATMMTVSLAAADLWRHSRLVFAWFHDINPGKRRYRSNILVSHNSTRVVAVVVVITSSCDLLLLSSREAIVVTAT